MTARTSACGVALPNAELNKQLRTCTQAFAEWVGVDPGMGFKYRDMAAWTAEVAGIAAWLACNTSPPAWDAPGGSYIKLQVRDPIVQHGARTPLSRLLGPSLHR